MKGNPKVIAELNVALREELTAINQYFIHAEMCHKWGYHALGKYIKKQSIDEMKHAEKLIERILFLDATPKMEYLELSIGGDVKTQLTADYKLELNAVEMYNNAVKIARDNNDDTSRELFALLLKDEEVARRVARGAAPSDQGAGLRDLPVEPDRGRGIAAGRSDDLPLRRRFAVLLVGGVAEGEAAGGQLPRRPQRLRQLRIVGREALGERRHLLLDARDARLRTSRGPGGAAGRAAATPPFPPDRPAVRPARARSCRTVVRRGRARVALEREVERAGAEKPDDERPGRVGAPAREVRGVEDEVVADPGHELRGLLEQRVVHL